jgi:hypothetical protein
MFPDFPNRYPDAAFVALRRARRSLGRMRQQTAQLQYPLYSGQSGFS